MLSKESTGRKSLIAIEGPDYSGKSSLAKSLASYINTVYQTKAMVVGRPGGTPECFELRERITNSKVSSLTRQCFALAEEVLFANTLSTPSNYDIIIFDRYNPISGQVYGPPEMVEPWQSLVSCGLTLRMDATIFIDTSKDVLIERSKEREDKNEMDRIFEQSVDRILDNYTKVRESDWTKQWCNPIVMSNNGSYDELYSKCMTFIDDVVDNSTRFNNLVK